MRGKNLLRRYYFTNDILKVGNQKEGIRYFGMKITEIRETLLSKARQTQLSITKVAVVGLLPATLTSLYNNPLKSANTYIFDP